MAGRGRRDKSKRRRRSAHEHPTLAARDIVVSLCFFLSGATALILEIAWVREASSVFGSTTLALSTVLATFFAGLALGSYALGRAAQRMDRPLSVYGLVEIGVGAFAILTPFAFRLADVVYDRVYSFTLESPAQIAAVRLLLTILIILPPTFFMGASLPLLSRHYIRDPRRISLTLGTLYGINTMGAAFGAGVCGFVMIPTVGVRRTIYAAAVISLIVGFVARRVGRRAPSLDSLDSAPRDRGSTSCDVARADGRSGAAVVHLLFLLTGFVALANEVLWTRFLSLMIYNTVHTYTLTLLLALVGIALGSLVTCWLFDRTVRRAFLFGLIQAINGVAVLFVMMLPAAWWQGTFDLSDGTSSLFVVAAVMFVPAVLSGMSFPLAVRMVLEHPKRAGATVGSMTAVNTGGGIVGALAGGFALIPLLGLHNGVLVTTGMSLVVAFAAWVFLDRVTGVGVKAFLVLLSIAAWLAIPRVTGVRLPHDHLAHGGTLLDVVEGRVSHLAVIDRDGHKRLEIDRLWQGEDRKTHQIMAAHLPMLLHAQPRSVLAIGMGTGQTFSRFLMYDIERLDCVEIEPELIELVRDHYDSAWMDDERCRIIVADGRNFVSHGRETYDVISVTVGQAFRPGVAAFYSADFYRNALERLNPGGHLCLFVPLRFFTAEEFRSIVRTFIETTADSALWYNRSELLLVGVKDGSLGLRRDRAELLRADPTIRDDLRFAHWGGVAQYLNRPEVFVAGFLLDDDDLSEMAGDSAIYTDDLPELEYSSARIRGRRATIPEGLQLIRDHLSPVRSACVFELDAPFRETAEALRVRNLDDIVAVGYSESAERRATANDPAQRIALLERALQHNPDNITILGKLGKELTQSRRLDQAIARFSHALEIDPESAELRLRLGLLLADVGRVDEAIAQYEQALRLRPRYTEAHSNLGNALLASGRIDDAIARYKEALALEPDAAVVHSNLGVALARRGDLEQACDSLREAVRLDPQFRDARVNLGRLLTQLGRTEEARIHLSPAEPDAGRP